mgnify:CR=1 FL=1
MSERKTKRREIRNYRDLFDDTSLGILVRDVLEECVEIMLETDCEEEGAADVSVDDLLKVIRFFSTEEEYNMFRVSAICD